MNTPGVVDLERRTLPGFIRQIIRAAMLSVGAAPHRSPAAWIGPRKTTWPVSASRGPDSRTHARRFCGRDGYGRPAHDGEERLMLEALLVSTGVVALAEMGVKIQIATVALAAHFAAPVAVVIGTTLGILLADMPRCSSETGLRHEYR